MLKTTWLLGKKLASAQRARMSRVVTRVACSISPIQRSNGLRALVCFLIKAAMRSALTSFIQHPLNKVCYHFGNYSNGGPRDQAYLESVIWLKRWRCIIKMGLTAHGAQW